MLLYIFTLKSDGRFRKYLVYYILAPTQDLNFIMLSFIPYERCLKKQLPNKQADNLCISMQ